MSTELKPIPERVEAIKSGKVKLLPGGHSPPDPTCTHPKGCDRELASWALGQEWTDHPDWESPVLAAFRRRLNDTLSDDLRQKKGSSCAAATGTWSRRSCATGFGKPRSACGRAQLAASRNGRKPLLLPPPLLKRRKPTMSSSKGEQVEQEQVVRLPFEDFEAGLVLHHPDRRQLYEVRSGINGKVSYFLPVERFLEMQRERNEFRKALAVINAHVTPPSEVEGAPLCDRAVITLLRNAGFSAAEGRAMRSIIGAVKQEMKERTDA